MPTYAYACKDCGHNFDIVQSFTDNSLSICPECQGALRKKFNSVGVVFKGPGFYRTDSRDSKGGGFPAAAKNGSGKDGSSKDGSSKEPAKESSSAGSVSKDSAAKTPAGVGASSGSGSSGGSSTAA
ncbi:FmdB family transcriptional regulator [Paeniglutamicibacter antarcticus]|uniref:FmdB family transcriptional regulator n=1 Tax=Arthrobacter terrae TaxID=2935737 RepID=A0A931CUS5_9MICC|nr:FmdB family zinc ribbon protein [Arthrobacter terrae]MBG0741331.1 FmdB family transcriptional regulator [Arthrobacter terrae]